MEFMFSGPFYWHWLALGVLLVIVEALAPGALFVWLGLAAGVTGLVVAIAPDIAFTYQVLVFAVVAVAATVGGRMFVKRLPARSDNPTLNRRGEQLVGRRFTLDEAIVNGRGKLRIDDTTWKVEGEDTESGVNVVVTGVDGALLKVEKA